MGIGELDEKWNIKCSKRKKIGNKNRKGAKKKNAPEKYEENDKSLEERRKQKGWGIKKR